MASYPDSIYDPRTVENRPGIEYDETKSKVLFAEDFNGANAEIVAIQETLGVNPQGEFDDVDERITVVEIDLEGKQDALGYTPLAEISDDTTPQLGGDLDLNEKMIKINQAPTGDHVAEGIFSNFTAGENLTFGQPVYLKSDGKVWKGNATDYTTIPIIGIAVESKDSESSVKILFFGVVRDDTWDWTVGGKIYLDTTAGTLTQEQPNGTDEVIQVLGIAIHADRILFNPQLIYITHV